MRETRWQANRIGLINFWYYDEQEYPFANGKMLLRGSNGSGKSVTMQSIIPLLLDGDMRPERLDPFGTRDRKLNSYLLEEDDEREERTGYLYLKFKKKNTEEYITIGMGLKGQKGKSLEKWYFAITDGRRIGKNLDLYRETGEKLTLTKRQLENRILPGGRIFEKPGEYMEFVNRQIFGFEKAEEYKEMIDLLIQLRTPKLSKGFKPSLLNEILSNSLQPLSDEDLRPMTESIEHLDTLSMNVSSLKKALDAAEGIEKSFDRYNRYMLFEKALKCKGEREEYEKLLKEEKRIRREIDEAENTVLECNEKGKNLDIEKETLEKEMETLKESDAAKLKEQLIKLQENKEKLTKTLDSKREQLSEKRKRLCDIQENIEEKENTSYRNEKKIKETIDDMSHFAEDMNHSEYDFFREEILENLNNAYDFGLHEKLTDERKKSIEKGLEIAKEASFYKKEADRKLKELDDKRLNLDTVSRELKRAEILMDESISLWKSEVYGVSKENSILIPDEEFLKNLSREIENYTEEGDYSVVRNLLFEIYSSLRNDFELDLKEKKKEIREQKDILDEINGEIDEWENMKEPEPERSEGVIENRKKLSEEGIPYEEFYRLLEFDESVPQEKRDFTEEALLESGILDALVVPEEYRERVLQMDKGLCDRYLFTKGHGEGNIAEMLHLPNEMRDIFRMARVGGIFENISCGDKDDFSTLAYIGENGSYRNGIVTGTVTGNYRATYIGQKARERARLEKIERLKVKRSELLLLIDSIRKEETDIRSKFDILEREYSEFPGEDDIKEARKILLENRERENRASQEMIYAEDRYQEVKSELNYYESELVKIAKSIYLTPSSEDFERAYEASREYVNLLVETRRLHELYLSIKDNMKILKENEEDLLADADDLNYDIESTENNLKEIEYREISIEGQLRITNYDEIRERLDFCTETLNAYPDNIKRISGKKAGAEERIRRLNKDLEENEREEKLKKTKKEEALEVFVNERNLGYIVSSEEGEDEICQLLESEVSTLRRENLERNLQQAFHEKKIAISDYSPACIEGINNRIDFVARYEGKKVNLVELVGLLSDDYEEKSQLIKDSERELFEDILSNTVTRKIRGKIHSSTKWIEEMNRLMDSMHTSNGFELSLQWKSKTSEKEGQMDTAELVKLMQKDYNIMKPKEAERLTLHFKSKVEEARKNCEDSCGMKSFYQVMKEAMDYRKWFEFRIFCRKKNEKVRELTDSRFGALSGGEKAMSMYVPLFAAIAAKYKGASKEAPRLISLDEAFAGVDNRNIENMFGLMMELDFDFIINSQILWGDVQTLDALAIYQLIRPDNAKFVTVMPYYWNGKKRISLENEGEMEEVRV